MFTAVLTTAMVAAATVETDPMIPMPMGTVLRETERTIIKETNENRARYGLPPLEVDPSLLATSRKHACWMASTRVFRHSSGVAENIARGQRDGSHAVNTWMHSSGHRANILNRNYKKIGTAAYIGSNGQIYFCQQFRR